MPDKTRTKINRLYQLLPEGAVAPLSWLQEQGYSRQLLASYVSSGWLEGLGAGGYYRPGTLLEWEGIVHSLQVYCALPLHVGSLSALETQGYAHDLPLDERGRIQLVSRAELRVPAWLGRVPLNISFEVTNKRLFVSEPTARTLVELPWRKDGKGFAASCPERAVLELLADVPQKRSFEQVAHVFEGLTRLRPKMVEELLINCHHIKVKRLFLFLAKHFRHRWFAPMDVDKIDLGSGKRVVVKGGRLDKEFAITIPAAFAS